MIDRLIRFVQPVPRAVLLMEPLHNKDCWGNRFANLSSGQRFVHELVCGQSIGFAGSFLWVQRVINYDNMSMESGCGSGYRCGISLAPAGILIMRLVVLVGLHFYLREQPSVFFRTDNIPALYGMVCS